MHWSLYQEIVHGASRAFRTLVPEPQDRIPLTWNNAIYPFICYVPFIFLAYLARRRDTYLIRLLLLPTAISSILVSAYRFTWTIPELNVYNWGQCLCAAIFIAKALEFGLTSDGMLKVGECKPGISKGKGTANGYADLEPEGHPLIVPWFYDAFELVSSLRGLRWKFGQGVHFPKETRPLERWAFFHATIWSFIKNYLLVDFLESVIKLFPGVGTPLGGSIFYPELSLTTRYVVSTLIHIMTGTALQAGFGMVYDLCTLVGVGLLDSSTTSWPPVMDDPWNSDSMHAFWAKNWHQLIRQTFIVFGGYPGKWIAGRVGMLFGTFIASGLFHECAMYSMNRGWNHMVVVFFALQGPILLLEQVWRQVTGRRVGGKFGRAWVYFVMFILAQPMVDAWHRRGLGGGMIIPPMLSPVRIFILPLVQQYLHRS